MTAKEFSENVSPKMEIDAPTPDKKEQRINTTTYIP